MRFKVKPHKKFLGIYQVLENKKKALVTLNLSPGKSVYGERLVEHEDKEYRFWNPYRSKLAAAILKGLPTLPIQPNHKVLYLGAASGTTVSHISDIISAEGCIYSIEFSFRSLRDLIIDVSAFRENVFPILADARFPERYRTLIETVDGIYCDIAQPEQARILADNADMFLREGAWALLVVKARSIDSTEEPSKIFRKEVDILKERAFNVKKVIELRPYDKAHIMVLAEYHR